MKRYRFTQIILLAAGCWLLATNCFAGPVSSEELIKNAKEYDGKEVVFQGEAIGDIMKRGNFYWVNISDGKSALGVFFSKTVLSDIMFTGDYNHTGDTVEVKGIFHRSCLEHGGDLDIHASVMTKVKHGSKIIHKIGRKKTGAVLWLTGILFIVIVLTAISKRYG